MSNYSADATTDTQNETSPRFGRRTYLAGAGTALASVSAGCMSGAMKQTEEITILLTPAEQPAEVKKMYMPMVKYIEDEVSNLSVSVDVATDYSAIWPALRSGQAHIAFDDVTLIQFPDKVDVLGTSVTSNTAYYFSMIMVLADSSYQSLSDLKGKQITFCDPISTSGSIYPLYALKQAGLDIGDAPKGKPKDFDGSWSSHDTSMQQLINRKEVAANANDGHFAIPHMESIPSHVKKYSAFRDEVDTEEPKMRTVWLSERIPKQPVITHTSWDSDKRSKVREVMLQMNAENLKQYTEGDSTLPFTGMKETGIQDYQPVIDRVNALGLKLR